MFNPPDICESLKISEKNCFREENPSRGASVTLPRHFRGRFREDFPPFFIVLRSSTGKFPKLNFSIHSMYP
ncbi:hypothetical protein HKD37_01G000938 [Glycine soja]